MDLSRRHDPRQGRPDRPAAPTARLAIVDYKTGQPPSGKQVEQGFALQLGTIGPDGAARRVRRASRASRGRSNTGRWPSAKRARPASAIVATPILRRQQAHRHPARGFPARRPSASSTMRSTAGSWASEPFTARLNPDVAGYATYDQLMRLDEWQGAGWRGTAA